MNILNVLKFKLNRTQINMLFFLLAITSCKKHKDSTDIENLNTFVVQSLPNYGIGSPRTELDFISPKLIFDDIEPCVKVTENDLKFGGYRSSVIDQDTEKRYSYDWKEAAIKNSIKLALSLGKVNIASADVDFDFSAANVITKFSYSTNTKFEIHSGTLRLTNFELTANAQSMLNDVLKIRSMLQNTVSSEVRKKLQTADFVKTLQFYLQCGDRFVHQSVLGAEFQNSFRVNFVDERALLNFYINATGNFMRKKVRFDWEKEENLKLSNAIVEIDTFQNGGDQESFKKFREQLGSSEASGSTSNRSRCYIEPISEFDNRDQFLNLINNKLNRCYESWNLTNEYLSENFYTQIKNRWNADSSNLALLRVHDMKYVNAGLMEDPILPDPWVMSYLKELNKILKTLVQIKFVLTNLKVAKERVMKASIINGRWADWKFQLEGNSDYIGLIQLEKIANQKHSLIESNFIKCKNSLLKLIKEEKNQQIKCVNTDYNFDEFKDYFLTL